MFVCDRNNKTQTNQTLKEIEYVYSVSKISNKVGRIDNFLAKARKLSILPTLLDIFDERQHYKSFLFVYCCEEDNLLLCNQTVTVIRWQRNYQYFQN